MDIVKINGFKVRLVDIRYGNDEAQTLTWARANVMLLDPELGFWVDLGKVHAEVYLQEGDVYYFDTGCKLALNVLKRKAIARFTSRIGSEKRELVKRLEGKNALLDTLAAKQHDLELDFKSLSCID